MRTERGVALPCSSQEDLARLNIVDMVSQHQPVHALQAVVGVKLFSQGPALRQQFRIAAAAVLLDPVLDDLPRLLGGAAVQEQGVLLPKMPRHIGTEQFNPAARTGKADLILDARTERGNRLERATFLFQTVQALERARLAATRD